MPKSRDKEREKEEKGRSPKKGQRALVKRVKKVLRKSRRKLGDEKFEKELQRTIDFLARLQTKLGRTDKEEKALPKSAKTARRNPAKAKARAGVKSGAKTATARVPAAKRSANARPITTRKRS
jgi:hypothetical protein